MSSGSCRKPPALPPLPGTHARRGRRAIIALVAVAAAGLCVLYGLVDPAGGTVPFPRCVWRMATGTLCPGCGSQRALHALLHGDVAAAVGHNALLTLTLPLVGVMLAASLWRERLPRLYMALNSHAAILGWVAAIMLWWIGRNVWELG